MKLDHEYIKKILEAFEKIEKPYVNLKEVCIAAEVGLEENALYHFEILYDMKLVVRSDGEIGVGATTDENGEPSISVGIFFRLTADGHEYLSSIKKPQIWNKAKKIAGDLGVGAMKEALKSLTQALINSQIN